MMTPYLTITLTLILPFAVAEPNVESASPQTPEGPAVYRDLPYVTNGHERQKLDLYVPKSQEKLPLIIRIHGGAWLAGSKEMEGPGDYVRNGYAVASINYRLSQHAIFPAQLQDCKAAVRFLRANAQKYNLDPNRFAVCGPSAGGHLAALLGTTGDVNEFDVGENLAVSSRVQAVVDYFGPTDFLQMEAHRPPNGMVHNSPDSPESKLLGGLIADNPEKAAKANPLTYITKDDPPFLIVHGDKDPIVPHHQSELLEAALKKAGVPVTFYTVKGAGHGGFKDPNVPKLTKEFFEKHLKTKPEQVVPTDYKIIESEDLSRKAMTKSLSSYTHQELVNLPIDKRMCYRVLVSSEIKENQVRPIVENIIADITSKDSDIDELTLFCYSDEGLVKNTYDVARATWAPGGELGNVTPEIAQSNNRFGYKITIRVADNLEQYLKQRAKSENRFGFTEAERRQIFKEIIAAGDKAQAEADRKYPISGRSTWDLSQAELRSQFDKNTDLMQHLVEQYKKELSKKYSLTQEQLKQISVEGINERWSLD